MARRLPALANAHRNNPIRYLGRPEPGFFKLRLRRHGAWVPAIIWRPVPYYRQHELLAMIGEHEADPYEVWERGARISPAVFAFMIQDSAWAKEHAPDAPEAQPYNPVNLAEMRTLF
jgi:hypothetical protein